MSKYINLFFQSYSDYWNYLIYEITNPSWNNYFYWLIGISLLCWGLEIVFPWRKNQSIFRKDFFLDLFYLFFNFFIFSLIIHNGLSNVVNALFNDLLLNFGINNLVAIQVDQLPAWSQLLILFVLADFIQWCIHWALHHYPFLWQFHKQHHSVKEMGFAAHFRYHWMENIVYKTLKYIPLSMIGFGIDDFFIVHTIAIAIGHLNHSNLNLDYGPLKYILNNPKMHIWHHAKEMPAHLPKGMNFGISLSIWDYLFKTAHIPFSGRDIELGFQDEDQYPEDLSKQLIYPISK